jgi:hypothetical protein
MQMSKRRISHFCPDHLLSRRARTAKISVLISPSSSEKSHPGGRIFSAAFFCPELEKSASGMYLNTNS